jgi:hypothetical protein
VLPAGFHRIRYYCLLASGKRAENVARARELLLNNDRLWGRRRDLGGVRRRGATMIS